MMWDQFAHLRERLERIEQARTHPFIRVRIAELRELLNAVDAADTDRIEAYARGHEDSQRQLLNMQNPDIAEDAAEAKLK